MTGKFRFTRWGIISLALVVALATIGVTYAGMSGKGTVKPAKFDDPFSWVVSNDDGTMEDQGGYYPIDPGDDGLDPSANQTAGQACDRYDERVASTTASLEDPYNITVLITKAYPSYYSTIFYGIINDGTVPATIESIVVDEDFTGEGDIFADNITALTVTVSGISVSQVIAPGEEVIGDLEVHVEPEALQNHTYTVRVTITTVYEEEKCGTAYAYGAPYVTATCFTDIDEIKTKNWGWSNGPLSAGEYTFDFYAGAGGCDITGGELVGTVTVDYDGSEATVTYTLDAGYTMDVIHLYVGNEILPLFKNKPTVSPGKYPYTYSEEDMTGYTYTVNVSGDYIYVVAHAVVCWSP